MTDTQTTQNSIWHTGHSVNVRCSAVTSVGQGIADSPPKPAAHPRPGPANQESQSCQPAPLTRWLLAIGPPTTH